MTTLVTRSTKGSELSYAEGDANITRDVDIKTTNYTTLVSDNRTTIECNHASTPFTILLGNAATMAAADTGDYEVTIANIGAAIVYVTPSGSDTTDGDTTTIILHQYSSVTLKVNAATDGYNSIARGLGGLTSTVAELNILDGVTSTAAELNHNDGLTSATVGLTDTQTLTNKTLTAPTLTSPVLNTGASGTAVLDEDDLVSDSATQLATQQSIKAYVDATYSSGTWTPVLWDSTLSDSESQTYSVQSGTYTKVGNRVFITGFLTVTSIGTLTGAQGANIGGLPFTSSATSNTQGGVNASDAGGLAITAGSYVSGVIPVNTAYISMQEWDATTGPSNLTIDAVSADGTIIFSGQYTV